MDFRQTFQQNPGRPATPAPAPSTPEAKEDKRSGGGKNKRDTARWMQVFSGIMLVGIAVLVAGIAVGLTRGNTGNEAKLVISKQYQAVFLNNGQVYFGNIDSLNNSYVRMTNIYYLTQSGDSTSSNYSLVKLGCQQIHDPADEMVINRSQVTFWENLNDSGKVVTSIKQFQKQNPNGPDCSQVSNQTQATPNATTQGGSDTGTGTGTGTPTTNSGTNSNTTK